jgi:hypothetical protein
MNLPTQSSPVQRSIPTTRMASENGVGASDVLDDILKVITTVGGVAAPILGSLI